MITGSGSERVVRTAAMRERTLACAALVRAGLAPAQAQSVVSMLHAHTDRAVGWLAEAERQNDRHVRAEKIAATPALVRWGNRPVKKHKKVKLAPEPF